MENALNHTNPATRIRLYEMEYNKTITECKDRAIAMTKESPFATTCQKNATEASIEKYFKDQVKPPMGLLLDATNSTTPASINNTIAVTETQAKAACDGMLQQAMAINK